MDIKVENIIIGGMQAHQSIKTDGICTCLTSSMGMDGYGMGNIIINDRGFANKSPQISYGICPTLRAENHGNLPKVIIDENYS